MFENKPRHPGYRARITAMVVFGLITFRLAVGDPQPDPRIGVDPPKPAKQESTKDISLWSVPTQAGLNDRFVQTNVLEPGSTSVLIERVPGDWCTIFLYQSARNTCVLLKGQDISILDQEWLFDTLGYTYDSIHPLCAFKAHKTSGLFPTPAEARTIPVARDFTVRLTELPTNQSSPVLSRVDKLFGDCSKAASPANKQSKLEFWQVPGIFPAQIYIQIPLSNKDKPRLLIEKPVEGQCRIYTLNATACRLIHEHKDGGDPVVPVASLCDIKMAAPQLGGVLASVSPLPPDRMAMVVEDILECRDTIEKGEEWNKPFLFLLSIVTLALVYLAWRLDSLKKLAALVETFQGINNILNELAIFLESQTRPAPIEDGIVPTNQTVGDIKRNVEATSVKSNDINARTEKPSETVTLQPNSGLNPKIDETTENGDRDIGTPKPDAPEPAFRIKYGQLLNDLDKALIDMTNYADWRDRDEIIRLLEIETSRADRKQQIAIKLADDTSKEVIIKHIQMVFDAVIFPVFRAVVRLHAYRSDVFDHHLGKNLDGAVIRFRAFLESIGFIPDAPKILTEFTSVMDFHSADLTEEPGVCKLTCYKSSFGQPSIAGKIVDIKTWGYKINKKRIQTTNVYIKHAK